MAQCQDMCEKGSARPPLKRTRRQLSTGNDEKCSERAPKRHFRNQDVDLRRSLTRSDNPRGGSQPTVEHGSTRTGSSRAWDEDDVAYMSGSEYDWSNMSTVCSTEVHMNVASTFTRGRWRSTCPELCRSGIPSGLQPMTSTGSDFGHTGAWIDCESDLFGDKSLLFDDESPESHPEVPDAPDLGKLATPHSSPMPSTFEFCYCCDDDPDADRDGRVDNLLRLSCRNKSDARLEWALAYMEKKRRKE
ncbi:hypothetical protein J3458_016618 [Metarhizium acridum]|uniref:uncharacterized protein n=1 Tax=Metarhizium acridum TaxID=92637 RepID=UPI001C6C11F0|nr:hypothetical protein J3458_016618 [Metarhizium acridum]